MKRQNKTPKNNRGECLGILFFFTNFAVVNYYKLGKKRIDKHKNS